MFCNITERFVRNEHKQTEEDGLVKNRLLQRMYDITLYSLMLIAPEKDKIRFDFRN